MRTQTGAWVFLALLLPIFAAPNSLAGQEDLPGISAGTITPETLQAFVKDVKMIEPPAGIPQKWFSSQAELSGTVSEATASSVVVVETMVDSEHVGRSIRITGNSDAAGQVRRIASNTSDRIETTLPFDIVPEEGDSFEIFTGSLPPGRWNGACTRDDPCLDINEAHQLAISRSVWLWFDSGDVWDTDDEWCDFTNSPPNRCLPRDDSFRHRILAQEWDDPDIVNEIRWGVSGTDLTGETFAVFDCDANLNYPPRGGGVFENQSGSSNPPAGDHPTAWLVVQGMETRCWNRPAPGTLTERHEWGESTGVYRREYSGKVLALHNRHGDLWDGASLVSGIGTAYSNGDTYLGGIVLVDIEANTADYTQMEGQCTATNTPYRSCQGTDFTGEGRGFDGVSLRPQFIKATGGGSVLWIGGDIPHRNNSGGLYTGPPRHFIMLGGFNDHFSNSGVGGTQHLTLVNLQLAGTPGDPSPADVVFALPQPDRWGTKYEIRILNSRFTDMPSGGAIAHFIPGWEPDRGVDTSLETNWVNVDVEGYGAVFEKDHSVIDGSEIDGGFEWTGRCLFIDGANPTDSSRIINVKSPTEDLDTRCKRNYIDVEGWVDGDDIANQFSLCHADFVSYASEAMAGTMLQAGNAGDVNAWQIFSQGNSGDWGGEGVDIDARAELAKSPDVQNAVLGGCNHSQVYPLGQTLPIGFLSTPDNLISNISLSGTRDLGFNPLWGQPSCAPPGEELSITTMTVDPDGKPVLHYVDPNTPSAVTGYNIYRSSTPAGFWTLVGAEVGDMDDLTPGIQFVDPTGDAGGDWYYKVVATNGNCEGP